MIPKACRLHRRWMLNVGACLALGVIPIAILGCIFLSFSERTGNVLIPAPLFAGALGFLALVGVGMLIGRTVLARRYDPNGNDAAQIWGLADERFRD